MWFLWYFMLNYSLAASDPKDCDSNNGLANSNTKDCVFYSRLSRKIWLSPPKDLGSIIRHRRVCRNSFTFKEFSFSVSPSEYFDIDRSVQVVFSPIAFSSTSRQYRVIFPTKFYHSTPSNSLKFLFHYLISEISSVDWQSLQSIFLWIIRIKW